MIKILSTILLMLVYVSADEYQTVSYETIEKNNTLPISEAVFKDYKSFYSSDRLVRLGIAFASGGVIANTQMDDNIQNWYQDNIRSNTTDNFSKVFKQFGEGTYLLPIALLSASINFYEPESDLGIWGVYTSRAYLVGAPVLLATQVLTGGSRPNEKSYGSQWKPFQDSNGVSGHAFMGAVPFLTLAKMYGNNNAAKYLAYAGSFLTAWSRINDDRHYFSQAALGWYLAYESVDAVFDADKKENLLSISPALGKDSYGIQVHMQVPTISDFTKDDKVTYSYGIHDFMLIGSHTFGINAAIGYSSTIFTTMSQKASLSAYVDYDPLDHDPDHIPVGFQGNYHLKDTLYSIRENFNLNTSVDLLWKMNTVSSTEQNFKSNLGFELEYAIDNFSIGAKLGGGAYYMEFDDDVPRARGFSRSDLTVGFVPAIMYGYHAKYFLNKAFSCEAEYLKWTEKNKTLEEDLSFKVRYKKSDNMSMILNIDKSTYNLDKYQKNNIYILPWNSDLLLTLTVEIPF